MFQTLLINSVISFTLALTTASVAGAKMTKERRTNAKAPAVSLRDQAQKEAKIDPQLERKLKAAAATTNSAPASIGILTLQDPRPESMPRAWSFFAGLSAQYFGPQGKVSKLGSGNFDLGTNASTLMPGLDAGFISAPRPTEYFSFQWGLRGKFGLTSQNSNITLPSGFRIDDARLNSHLLSAGGLVSFQSQTAPRLSVTVSPQVGNVTYTQTSSSDFANFSKQATFTALGVGFAYLLSHHWSLTAEYTQRDVIGNEVALQKDNYELGAKVTW